MFFLYQLFITTIIILSPLIIVVRLLKSKEDPKRLTEKFFFKKDVGLKGNTIWFHAASIGEFLSIIPLIFELEKNKKIKRILITTSTLSSSKIFKNFKFKKTQHQFFPIDSFLFSRKFLNYWKPKVAIFVDSEIWPNMFREIYNQSIPLLLINARITKKSFNRWTIVNQFALKIFSYISIAFPQTTETHNYLEKLNVKKIYNIGNLKLIKNTKLQNIDLNRKIIKAFKKRTIFIASSTHQTEELLIAKSHLLLKNKIKNILTVIIPRHTHRINNIKEELNSLNLNVFTHGSKGKPSNNTDIYLVNTYGQTKSFLKYAKLVFMGGSIVNHGGQNPIEAAHYNARVIHGPNIDNFREIYQLFNKRRISFKIKNLRELTSIAENLLKKKNKKINIDQLGTLILKKSLSEIGRVFDNEVKKT